MQSDTNMDSIETDILTSEQLTQEQIAYIENLFARDEYYDTAINLTETLNEMRQIDAAFPISDENMESAGNIANIAPHPPPVMHTQTAAPEQMNMPFFDIEDHTTTNENGDVVHLTTMYYSHPTQHAQLSQQLPVQMQTNFDTNDFAIPRMFSGNLFSAIMRLLNQQGNAFHMEDVRTPMTENAFNNLPEKKFNEITEQDKCTTCAICQDTFENESVLKILPCRHYFHKTCIERWLRECHHICPVCRADCGEHTAVS